MNYVTYSELFAFCMVIISVIALVIEIVKRSDRHGPSKASDHILSLTEEPTITGQHLFYA